MKTLILKTKSLISKENTMSIISFIAICMFLVLGLLQLLNVTQFILTSIMILLFNIVNELYSINKKLNNK